MLDLIREAMLEIKMNKVEGVTKLDIYYCGHGHEDMGGWVCYHDKQDTKSNT